MWLFKVGEYACLVILKQLRRPKNWLALDSLAPSSLWPEKSSIETTDVKRPQIQPEHFPPVFFLDSHVFQHNHLEIPKISIPLPPYASDFIGDAWTVGDKFFTQIHKWMPFISKKWYYEKLLNPLSQPRADVTILIFCMKLISWLPSESANSRDARTSSYLFAKRTLLEAEVAGILSLQVLQAWLLVTIYELGHAIYPSAYMSIATCARYGSLLDLKCNRSQVFRDSATWVELEERRRTWWSIVVLDRSVLLSLYVR